MTTPQEAENLLAYLREHTRMSELSNEDLCRELLREAPVFGRLGELVDIIVERVCPGIITKMDEETACEPTDAMLDAERDGDPKPPTTQTTENGR